MFILELENEENLWNVMSENFENRGAKYDFED